MYSQIIRILSTREDLIFKRDIIRRVIADIVKQDRLRFDPSSYQQEIRDVLSKFHGLDGRLLVSAESLTTLTVDRLTKAERVRDIFGSVEILLCLRRPEDFMVSLYGQYIKNLDTSGQRRQLIGDWLEGGCSYHRANSVTRLLEFSRLIRGYHSIFGMENVHVLLFEELLFRRAEFAQRLSRCLGIDDE